MIIDERNGKSVAVNYNETGTLKKRKKSLIRGCSAAQQVHLLPLLRVLELKGTSALPTPGPSRGPRPNQTFTEVPKGK